MNIRNASESDVEPLYAIYMHESVNPYMGFDECSLDQFRPIFRQIRSDGDLLVFEQDVEIVGVCSVTRREHRLKHVAYIGNLAVKPNCSGRGVGRAILAMVLNMLKDEGFRRVELLVACDNARAIGLFRSFGFEIEGTLRSYFSRSTSKKLFDEHVMALLHG